MYYTGMISSHIPGRLHSLTKEKLSWSCLTFSRSSTESGRKTCYQNCLRSSSVQPLYCECHASVRKEPSPSESMEFCLSRSARMLVFFKLSYLYSTFSSCTLTVFKIQYPTQFAVLLMRPLSTATYTTLLLA